MGPKKKVTFDDIAKYTHFSKTTISRYFNNPDSLTLENQEIIANALEKLNYKENKVARILANGRTEFIGILIPDLYHHYYSEVLNQILATYETYGYKFLVFTGNANEDIERQYIKELLAYQIEGMIILSHTIPSRELADLPIPIVTIEREDQFVSSINTDNYMGGYQATSLLAKHNCDVIIHVNSHTPKNLPSYARITGFQDCCREQHLKNEIFFREFGNSYESSLAPLQEILDILDQKYAGQKKGVFIANDTLANTFLNLLFRKHGCFPQDYLLIGFDNSPVSQEAVVPISTIGQQIDKLAFEAVALLVEQMDERKKRRPAPPKDPVHKIITPILYRRETTERD